MGLGSALAFVTGRVLVPVEGMHRAAAEPWIAATGPLRGLVEGTHDLMLRSVYGSIQAGSAAIGAGVDRYAPAVDSDGVVAVVNGLWGDDLGPYQGRLDTEMAFRDRSGSVITVDGVWAESGADGIDRLVILVHGFAHTERCWSQKNTEPGLLDVLDGHRAVTPLTVRYNSGLPVADNGSLLSDLIEELVAGGPAPVGSVSLVGYSMGGLVVRSAVHAAQDAGYSWLGSLGDIVTVASPHRGTPVEKLVHAAGFGLDIAPATRPLAAFLETRSDGIRGLRHGSLDDRPPESVAWHFIAGVITADPHHPVGAIMGDLVVRPTSGTGPAHIEPVNVSVVGGVHHIDLLHDGAVLDAVTAWLDPRPTPA